MLSHLNNFTHKKKIHHPQHYTTRRHPTRASQQLIIKFNKILKQKQGKRNFYSCAHAAAARVHFSRLLALKCASHKSAICSCRALTLHFMLRWFFFTLVGWCCWAAKTCSSVCTRVVYVLVLINGVSVFVLIYIVIVRVVGI